MWALLQDIPDDQPISQDAWFVHNGYQYAFQLLFDICIGYAEVTNEHVIEFGKEVVSVLISWCSYSGAHRCRLDR